MGKPLIVIGSGPERRRLKRMAGPTVKILGAQPLSSLKELYANCRALVFPGEEDFGIVPVEALAAGRPIIAYGRGGILDTITDGVNGILYAPQSTEGLIGAVRRFEAIEERFSPQGQKQSAERFSRLAFRNSFSRFVDDKMAEHFARVSKASQ